MTIDPAGWPAGALPLGSQINGRFEVQAVLGVGGFGITYAAWDHHLQRHVAVKEFLPSDTVRSADGSISSRNLSGFSAGLERFLSEGRVLAKLNHPGIVGVFDVVSAHGTAYLVMDYLVGETVEQALHREGKFAVADATRIVSDLCAALAFLHNEHGDPGRQALLHLDVSPSNIILVDGAVRRPVLIDLGSARAAAASGTQDYSRIVKAGFSAPELYSAVTPRSPSSDVYSLAATAYQMFAGAAPPDCMERAQGASLPPLETLNPDVPPLVGSAISHGLSLRANERPSSVSLFLNTLTRGRVAGPDASKSSPLSQEVSAHTRMVAPASSVLNPGASPVGAAGGGRGGRGLLIGALGFVVLGLAVVAGVLATRSSPNETAASVETTVAPAGTGSVDTEPVVVTTDPTASASGASNGERQPVPDVATAQLDTTQVPPSQAGSADPRVQVVSVDTQFQRATVRRNCGGEGRLAFPPAALVDGDPQTGWGASAQDGSGASITLGFGRPRSLTRIGMIPGFTRQGKRSDLGCQTVNAFYYNRVVTSVRYDFDDGSSIVQSFEAVPEMQFVSVNVTTASVRMTILSTERTRDNDTIISEMTLFERAGAQ